MNLLKNKALKKVLLTFFSRGISAGGTLLLTFSLGHLLGASGTGLFMIGFSIMMGLKAVGCLGMENAILRFGGSAWGEKKFNELSYFYTFSIIVAFIICFPISVSFFLLSEFIAKTFFIYEELSYIFKLVAIAYPFLVISSVACAWMRACGFPEISSFFEIGSISLFLSIIMWLVYFCGYKELLNPAFSMVSLLSIVVFESIIGCFLLRFLFKLRIKASGSKKEARKFLFSLGDYFCIDFIFYMTQWGGVIFLGVFSSSVDVGVFTIAHRVAFTINFILNVFESIVAPKFSYLNSKGDGRSFRKLAHNTTKYMSILALPLVLLMLACPTFILRFWGEEFAQGKYILILLALAQFTNIATGPVAFILCMTGFQKTLKYILFVSFFIGFMGYIILVPIFGGEGAAFAIFLAVLIQNITPVFYVKKIFGFNTLMWWR